MDIKCKSLHRKKYWENWGKKRAEKSERVFENQPQKTAKTPKANKFS